LRLYPAKSKLFATLPADRTALRDLDLLVVDDTTDTATIMREVLVRHGARAQAFANADDALAAARAMRFDVILSDVAMPGTDGFAFLAALRATPNHATPVIMTSGYSQANDIARARTAGARDYLVKPIRTEVLVGAIRRAVDRAEGHGG
jgi:two-component system, chemotaxis family, CheB/CheR fusion protein